MYKQMLLWTPGSGKCTSWVWTGSADACHNKQAASGWVDQKHAGVGVAGWVRRARAHQDFQLLGECHEVLAHDSDILQGVRVEGGENGVRVSGPRPVPLSNWKKWP